jgi:hypothetical protein
VINALPLREEEIDTENVLYVSPEKVEYQLQLQAKISSGTTLQHCCIGGKLSCWWMAHGLAV